MKGRGPGKVFAYKSKALPVDVRHEGTHGLLHAALPMVPLWLDEGLAEYFEVPGRQPSLRQSASEMGPGDVGSSGRGRRRSERRLTAQLEAKRDVSR